MGKLLELLFGALKKVTPQERILLICFMIAIVFLVETVRGFVGSSKQDYINQIIELKIDNSRKDIKIDSLRSDIVFWRHSRDSLYFIGIRDKQETIDKLRLISKLIKQKIK